MNPGKLKVNLNNLFLRNINLQWLVKWFYYHAGGHKDSHIRNVRRKFLPVGTICTTTDTISIPMGTMYLQTEMFCTLAKIISIPVSAMYLHVRTLCTLTDMISISVVQCIYMQEHSEHLLIRWLYPLVQCNYMQERSVHFLIWWQDLLVQCITCKNVMNVQLLIWSLYPLE